MSDRWVEVDVDWFGTNPCTEKVRAFVDRVTPLLDGEREQVGVILNVGWLSDVVTLFSGDLNQRLPLQSRRYGTWREHSYDDLRRLIASLREEFGRGGIGGVKIGLFTVGWGEMVLPESGEIYDLRSEWKRRHPELYGDDGEHLGLYLDPRVPLAADECRYAGWPNGIREGTSYAEFFGAQWRAISDAVGFDTLHLRDGWLGQMIYRRRGPYGVLASSDPAQNRSWTEAMRAMCANIKWAAPDTLLMLYSSALSQTAEWLTGCIDLEAVIEDGAVDIFVDQTWGGAWQDWWPLPTLAWTFQSAFLATHGAVVRGTDERRDKPCKHYGLIETWDGWEPWDTLHRTPEKLRWATWSFAHSAVVTPHGIRVPDGMYISWMNDPRGALIDKGDADWLATALNEAAESAAGIEAVLGPVIVHNREALLAAAREHPADDVNAWVEDQAAMLAKFGVPLLGATRAEWLPDVDVEAAIVALPQQEQAAAFRQLAENNRPLVFTGRADLICADTLELAGVAATTERREQTYRPIPPSKPTSPGAYDVVHLPDRVDVVLTRATSSLSELDGTPVVAIHGNTIYWQAAVAAHPEDGLLDNSEMGSLAPYVDVAKRLNEALARTGAISIHERQAHESITLQAWVSRGVLHVLIGNLETGWTGDSRYPRNVRFDVPRRLLSAGMLVDDRGNGVIGAATTTTIKAFTFEVTVGPEAMVLLRGATVDEPT